MQVTISVEHTRRAYTEQLRRIQQRLTGDNQRMRTARRDCGIVALNDARVVYLGKSAGGGGWRPLAPSTLRRKTKPPRKGILRVTDALYESLRPGNPNNVLRVVADGVWFGTRKWYGKFHQEGTATIPIREILQKPRQNVIDRCREIFRKAIRDVITRN